MIFYIYILTIFSFVFGQLGRFQLSQGLVIQLTDVMVASLVCVWIIKKIIAREYDFKKFVRPYTFPLMLFTTLAAFSLLINVFSFTIVQISISSLYLVRWIMYACLLLIVREFSQERKYIVLFSLIISSFLLVILGYIQYFLYPNLRNIYYLGWDDHLYRLVSTILDPNFTAVIINLQIFLIVSLYYNIKNKTSLVTFLLSGISIISFIALLLTYSRSGYVMFMVGITVLLWMSKKRKILVGAFILILIGIFLLPKDLGSSGVELWRTYSIFARTKTAGEALVVIRDHPLFGVGFNTYRYVQSKYGFVEKEGVTQSHAAAGTDNSFLFVFATTGIIGGITYLYLWKKILSEVLLVTRKTKQKKPFITALSLAFISSVSGLFVNALFINSLFFPAVLFWLWSVLGIIG